MERGSVYRSNANRVVKELLPALTPVVLVLIGYIDPGKWATCIDVGARFGGDLVAFALVFNFVGVLCHYLSARISVITGRNLAQICIEEYDKLTCFFLGVQAEASIICLDLTMILGIAHGLNMLFGLDLFTGILFTALNAVLYPLFSTLLESSMVKLVVVCMAGLTIVCYVLGMLTSVSEYPVPLNGLLSKLSGESAFALMGLLGANVMPHNFYLHSSIVQRYQGPAGVSTGAWSQDNLILNITISSGIFFVNYVLMNTAASGSYSTGLGLLTFQDAMSLLDQAYRNSILPFASFLILFLSNQIVASSWEFGGESGEMILHDFFNMDLPEWLHRATVRIFAVVTALFCLWHSGAEGIYHLLICTQVLVALLLPCSVIPLFRVVSCRTIMGIHKISPALEFVVLLTFIGMLGLEFIFVVEMIFGESDWVGNLHWSIGSGTSMSYILLLLTSCLSLFVTLWVATTPLKSSSNRLDSQTWNWDSQVVMPELCRERETRNISETRSHEDDPFDMKNESLPSEEKSNCSHPNVSDVNLPETIMDGVHEPYVTANSNIPTTTSIFHPEPEQSITSVEKVTASSVVTGDSDNSDMMSSLAEPKETEPAEKTLRIEGDSRIEKDEEVDTYEPVESSKNLPAVGPSTASDGPGSFRSLSGKGDEGGTGAGSLSRLSGLGRAARRQLAAALDEFWGQLYDFHGQLTQEAKSKKLDVLLGVDSKPSHSLPKADPNGKEFGTQFQSLGGRVSNNSMSSSLSLGGGVSDNLMNSSLSLGGRVSDNTVNLGLSLGGRVSDNSMNSGLSLGGRVSDNSLNSSIYDAATKQKLQDSIESAYRARRGSASLWSNQLQLLDSLVQSSSSNRSALDAGERRYQSLRFPQSSDGLESQPATIHGYQLASYINRMGKDRQDYALSQLASAPQKSPSLAPNNYRDSLAFVAGQQSANGFNSVQPSSYQNLAALRNSVVQSEKSGYDLSAGAIDRMASQNNAKKYHSLPDISGLSVPLRNSYLPDRSKQLDSPNTSMGFGSPVGRSTYEHSSFSNTRPRSVAPLAFDQLSPNMAYRDTFSMSSGSGGDSLWSRQPYEQFGLANDASRLGALAAGNRSSMTTQQFHSVAETESKLLQSLRHCILKLLKLEGSEWLFRENDGVDEDLIDRVATREKFVYEVESLDFKQASQLCDSQYAYSDPRVGANPKGDEGTSPYLISSVTNCGEGCVWKVDLIVSFGVWCIHRILELSLMESRPELWGKYTYVLNRLQGVIELAFFKPRTPMSSCFCLQVPTSYQIRSSPPVSNSMLPPVARPAKGKVTSAATMLEIIKDVEIAISSRKGRSGTAAGDVAFPKGKENLASVLKRYKRRLSNKPVGANDGPGSRKLQSSTSYGNS